MSNYGPKDKKLYNEIDNLKRKSRRTGDDVEEAGPITAVKSFSTKPGQLSSKQQATSEDLKYKALNRMQPVKVFTKEEIAKLNKERKDD